MRMPAKGLVIHSALQGGNHGGTESTEKVTVGWVEHRETHHFRRDIVSRRVSLRSTHPTSSCPSLCSPCLRGEFAYSAACVLSRTVLAISFCRSNSARRRALSSGDKRAMFEKSSFQSGWSLQRNGDCTVVRGPGAVSRNRNASSSVKACEFGSFGRPAGLPSGKSLNKNRGTPTYSTMSLAHPMMIVGMPLASR